MRYAMIVPAVLTLASAAILSTRSEGQEHAAIARMPEEIVADSGLSLAAVVVIAEQNSPALRQTAAEIDVARGRTRQAGLYPNPAISGGSPQWGGSGSQYYGQLSQEIITKGKLRLDRAATSQEIRQAEMRFLRARFDLLTNVRSGFYSTLAGQQRVEILTELVGIATQSQDSVEKLLQGGEVTKVDLFLIQIEREKAELARQNATAILDATRRQLAATAGQPSVPMGEVHGNLNGPFPDVVAMARESGALEEHGQIQIARAEAEKNRWLLRRAVVQPCPNITVAAGYLYQVTEQNNNALLSVEIPIPAWNRNQGGIQAARASVSSAVESIDRTFNELSSQLATAVGRYQAAQQQSQTYEELIRPKARQTLELIRAGMAGGQFNFLTLLQAQRSLVEADLGYVNALEAQWIAASEIAGLLQLETFP